MGLPYSSNSKESACNAGDLVSIPGLGRSSGEGNGNPLQYSYLESPTDRGAWWATVREVAKNRTQLTLTHCLEEYVLVSYVDKYIITMTELHTEFSESSTSSARMYRHRKTWLVALDHGLPPFSFHIELCP